MDVKEIKKYRAYIECDACGKTNAPLCCSKCKRAYYCSVACQRTDWSGAHHSTCQPHIPVGENARATLKRLNQEASRTKSVHAKNTACGICWEEPMHHPVTLACRHAFCWTCLTKWQGNKGDMTNQMSRMYGVEGGTSGTAAHTRTTCPLCRHALDQSVALETLGLAIFYCHQGQSTHPETKVSASRHSGSLREQLFRRALTEIEKVVPDDAAAQALAAHMVHARILSHVNPPHALSVIQHVFQLNDSIQRERAAIARQIQDIWQSLQSPHTNAYVGLDVVQRVQELVQKQKSLECFGEDPMCLYPARLILGRAYEGTHQWTEAYAEYAHMAASYRHHGPAHFAKTSKMDRETFMQGMARCALELDQCDVALTAAESSIQSDRHAGGGHLILARVQRAMAQRATSASTTPSADGSTDTCFTLQDAVRTMYRGIVYETPWGDDDNETTNRLFLQELLAEAKDSQSVPMR